MMKGNRREMLESFFEAAKDAGRELVINGKIPKRLLDEVSRSLMSEEEYEKSAKEMMEQIKKSMTF